MTQSINVRWEQVSKSDRKSLFQRVTCKKQALDLTVLYIQYQNIDIWLKNKKSTKQNC